MCVCVLHVSYVFYVFIGFFFCLCVYFLCFVYCVCLGCTLCEINYILVKFLLARGECLTLTLWLGVIPANIAINDMSLKTRFFGLYFAAPKATEFGEITQKFGLLIRSPSFKVTEFGTNRKLI